MKKEIYKAEERGKADHGWLQSRFSFSFADYHDPSRMGFGKLRVLNDDIIAPDGGFGMHPHDNMEIVTIILQGALEHEDDMGNKGIIKRGEVQRISAGSGITHSEVNASKEKTNLLQIWIETKEQDIKPSYEQNRYEVKKNEIKTIVSGKKIKNTLYIHQDAYFSIGKFEKNKSTEYTLKTKMAYIFVIEGNVEIEKKQLSRRDAIGISETDKINITAKENSEFLIIEI